MHWEIVGTDDLKHKFNSRLEALCYAMNQSRLEQEAGLESSVELEGSDGVWRSFDRHMKSIK